MGALFRLVSLVGVMSAGFYVLYLAQGKLTEPQSLVETVGENAEALALGPDGSSSQNVSVEKPNTAFPGKFAASTDQWEPAPVNTDPNEMFAKSRDSSTTVVTEPFFPEAASSEPASIDFRDPTGITATPAILKTANSSIDQPGTIRLVASGDPFAEDVKPVATTPAESSEADPFSADDPFGEKVSDTPNPVEKSDPLKEFDPFGESITPLKTTPAKPAPLDDAFPGLSDNHEKPTAKKEVNEKADPVPFSADDPFAPFAEEKPVLKDSNRPVLTKSPIPAVKEDPFPEFPGIDKKAVKSTPTPVPTPSEDPFGDFPSLDSTSQPQATPAKKIETPQPSSDDPFGEDFPVEPKKSLDAIPSFPGELKPAITEIKKNPAESSSPLMKLEEEPPLTGFPALDNRKPEKPNAAPRKQPLDAFPELDPLDGPKNNPESIPKPAIEFDAFPSLDESPKLNDTNKKETLPPIDDFPMLEEKLKNNAKEIQLQPVPRELEPEAQPEPRPSFDEPPGMLPELNQEARSPADNSLKGEIPSLTELQGDGVVQPDTPREMKLPHLEITKQAPPKALLNKPFVYTIVVKNVGDVAANEVTVQDQIPKGSNLTGTIPQAELVGRRLVWALGRIEPGQEQKIAIRIVPVEPGPLGSVATVNFVAEVGSETVIEHPQVTFNMKIPTDAKVGEIVDCTFTIENHGTDTVTGIVLRDIIPAGMHHPSGHDLENSLGDLSPGQKRSETLQLKVLKAGRHINEAVLTAEGGLSLKQKSVLNAAGNRLEVKRRGPQERFIGRAAIYQNDVSNTSNEVVNDAIVVEKLSAGMQFQQAGQGGQYHASSREIHWRINQIAPGQTVQLQSRMIPTQAGHGESLVRVMENQGDEIQLVSHTQVRSYASIGLEMTQLEEPILMGDTVKMRIEATNRGNASAQSVELRAIIPPTMELLTVGGETRFRVEGREVVFETLNALPPGATEIIELELTAAAASPAEVAVSVKSREMIRPLVKASAIDVHSRQ
ncbi:MAG: hypothetical protein P8M30_06130 [Planctomycetaceae bacterium]|nr:hypothetical protein [Planctomycetaceae bacterium]